MTNHEPSDPIQEMVAMAIFNKCLRASAAVRAEARLRGGPSCQASVERGAMKAVIQIAAKLGPKCLRELADVLERNAKPADATQEKEPTA